MLSSFSKFLAVHLSVFAPLKQREDFGIWVTLDICVSHLGLTLVLFVISPCGSKKQCIVSRCAQTDFVPFAKFCSFFLLTSMTQPHKAIESELWLNAETSFKAASVSSQKGMSALDVICPQQKKVKLHSWCN